MGDFEAALANAPAITSLHFDFREDGTLDGRIAAFVNLEELQLREVPPDLALPDELLALPRLRHLGMTGKDDRLVVPELVRRLRIQRLDVWDVRADELPPLPHLAHLEIVVAEPRADVAILAERFHQLEHLEVWGSNLPSGELPDDIERFGRLRTLRLISCGVRALPDTIAKLRTLHTFGIRGCPMHEIPEVLTRMPGLAVLELGAELTGLPPVLAGMTGLRELQLGNALNKGAMLSRSDDISTMRPLPRVLGELAGLEKLNLDCCGVFDITALRPLTKLRSLSVEWSAVSDITPLAELTALEHLSLANCDRIRDLGPLAALKRLRALNIGNTRPASLDVLRQLPALRELHIESIETKRMDAVYDLELDLHADDDVKERYAARASLRGLPSVGELVVRLGDRDLAIVETACDQLVAWVASTSSPGDNAISALRVRIEDDEGDDDDDDDDDEDDDDDDDIDDDDDDEDDGEGDDDDGAVQTGGYLPAVDLALDRHLAQLSAGALAKLFGALFRSVCDNYSAATRIANELVSRTNVDAAQLVMVDGFIEACERDARHREHAHTVHDGLLEEVFPLLNGPALAKLLAWCDRAPSASRDAIAAMRTRLDPKLATR